MLNGVQIGCHTSFQNLFLRDGTKRIYVQTPNSTFESGSTDARETGCNDCELTVPVNTRRLFTDYKDKKCHWQPMM